MKDLTPSLLLRSYREIESKISRAIADLERFVEFNGKSISVPKDVGSQIPHITEYVGESIGLSVVNQIHNLTEADWDKIRESKGPHAKPTLDYQHEIAASDGKRIIQVETKGSCVQDNRNKSEAIWSHKANIVNKKCEIRNLAENGAYPYPADVRYGTIAAVDFRTDGTVRCWLLDPDPGETDISPESFRLLSRIRFLRDWISFLSPRSQLATSMATRVAALESLDNPFQLDGVPLRKGNNELFEIVPFHFGRHSAWFANKSRVTDGPAGGVVVQLSDNLVIFLGLREELLVLASEQEFKRILEHKAEAASMTKEVECVVSKGRFREFTLPGEILESVRESPGYVHFHLEGQLYYTSGGIVFGLLPL